MEISRKDNQALKGIAIILMMALHFWGQPSWILPENMYKSLLFQNDVFEAAGQFGNVCVSIFTFLIGYGLIAANAKWNEDNYRIRKLVLFITNYWIYCIVFWIAGLTLNEELPSISTAIYNIFGLGNEVGIAMAVPFAWYVSFYISVLLLYRVITKISEQNLGVITISMVVIYALIKILLYLFDAGYITNWAVWDFLRREDVLLTVLAGMVIAKYEILSRLSSFKVRNRIAYYTVVIAFLLLIACLRVFLNEFVKDFMGIAYTLAIIVIVQGLKISEWKFIGDILVQLGKYSMGMWFISGIFFTTSCKLQWIAYLGGEKPPILVLIWVVMITFGLSYIITEGYDHTIGRLISAKLR